MVKIADRSQFAVKFNKAIYAKNNSGVDILHNVFWNGESLDENIMGANIVANVATSTKVDINRSINNPDLKRQCHSVKHFYA